MHADADANANVRAVFYFAPHLHKLLLVYIDRYSVRAINPNPII